ncbi:MAG: dipeptidase PepV [Bacilli bacterium]|nr:dipeptidase PepV [Bacilli bacterium]
MNKDFTKVVNDNKELVIKTLQELLQIRSVLDEATATKDMPFGKGINDALNYMMNLASKDGFKTIRDGGYAGEVSYGNGEEVVGILCHLDVVPEGKNWTYPPYEARIVDNKIYARGSTDDKGPTIAAYYALKFIKDANIKLKKQIKIIFGTDEETGWRGIHHYLTKHPMPSIGFAPDCSFPLVYGEKGRMAIDVSIDNANKCALSTDAVISIHGGERYNVVIDEATALARIDKTKEFSKYLEENNLTGDVVVEDDYYKYFIKGVAAHAMEPEKGINAGTHMCNFFKDYSQNPLIHYIAKYHHLDYYLKNMKQDYTDYEMGPLTCNIGIIDITKDAQRVCLDIRYPERFNQPVFEENYQKLMKELGLKVTNMTNKNPHYVSPQDELVQKLYEAYVKHTGDTVNKPFTVGGGTYASILNKAVAYGMGFPGEEELAHQRDEFLNIESLIKGILIYIDAIIALGEIDA